ncbi:hypothetical protein [Bacillus anthracis]|uniref:hypothetical protein n=1 Tax=Bacillus anthracis TaxID=1392 RepID=UPI000AE48525|nr:hypothetical protein [Bacillus anthracis]
MKAIRNTFNWYGNVMLNQNENGTYYVYYFGRTLWLKEKILKRVSIFIIHSAIIEMEQEKFMKDLTRMGVRTLETVKLICSFCSFCSMGNSRNTTAILIGKLLTTTVKVMQCEVNRRDSMRNKKKGLAVVPAVL